MAAGAVMVLGLTAAAAVAAPKARLSRDLSEALAAGDASARDVILQADAATIDAVAARHGAVVKRRLATGAVLTVPGGQLSSLSSDASVDHLSGDLMVRSMMAVTDQAIAADQAWAGAFAAARRHRSRRRRRVHRFGLPDAPGREVEDDRVPGLHRPERRRRRQARSRARTSRASSPARATASTASRRARRSSA